MTSKSPKTQPPSSSDDPVTDWAADVVAGRVVAGPHIRNAAARHLRDLKDGPSRGLCWDLAAARRALEFFPSILRLNGGQFEGNPFVLHPSQAFRVGSLFGWKRPDGSRRFRRYYDEGGKGCGKSPLLAGIGLYALMADGEARAEVYAAASKKDQAMILFRDAVAMVDQSPALSARLTKSGGNPVWNLAYMQTGSFFRPISSDEGQSGPRPHFALCDEVHEHRDRRTIDMLERGFKFRRQPLLCMATNSGTDRNSVCWEEREHAVKVAAGDTDDDSTFSFVCGLDEGDDPLEDPSCWIKANPLLGVTITHDYLAGVVKQAKDIAGKRNGILRLHFCVWTDSETAWIEREAWSAIEDPELTAADAAGQRTWIGLDLSATRDLTGKALVWEDGVDAEGRMKYAAVCTGFLPEHGIAAKAIEDKAPYEQWVDEGHLTATPGKVVRLDYIAKTVVDDAEMVDLQAVSYDRFLFTGVEEELDALGVTLPLIEHPQGWNKRQNSPLWMPGSINELEKLILEGRLRVGINPALRSAVMSASFMESAAGLRRFSKQKSTARIDLVVALAMAIGAAVANEERESSFWETAA